MDFNYDFAGTPPMTGGGKNFPVSPEGGWLCQIVGEEMRPMTGGQGSRLVFLYQGLEGAVNGVSAENGHNIVHHSKPETVQRALAEISAIGYAVGVLAPGRTRLGPTTDLFNKPFRVIVVQSTDPRFTEIVGYRAADGRDPVKIANGSANVPTHGAPGGQPAGMPQGQAPGFGGAPQGQAPGFGITNGQPQQGFQGQPQQQSGFAPQGGQPGFGGNPAQGQPGMQQGAAPGFGNGQPQQGQPQAPAGGGWGQPQVGQPGQGGAPQWGGGQQGGAPQGQPQWGQG